MISATSCDKKNNTSSHNEIPTLLERNEKLQYSNEWSEVRSKYADLKHRIKTKANNCDALIQLSNLYIGEARVTGEHGHYYPAALQMINQALSIKNINKDQLFLALSNKASVQLSQHDFINARETAQQALTLNPYNAQIYGALVDANVELGNYDEAVTYADQMVAIRPDLSSYSRVSYLREIYGMPDQAIEALQMAVEAGNPASDEKSWAALQLAQLCQRYKQTDKAEFILKQILTERENYPFAIAALAEIHIAKKQYQQAELELKEACKIIPEVSFYVSLANIYKIQNRTEELKNITNEIVSMIKDDMDHGHNMSLEFAHVYLDLLDNPDQALITLDSDRKMRPDNIDINKLLSKIYIIKKEPNTAAKFLEKANKTKSKDPILADLNQTFQNKL